MSQPEQTPPRPTQPPQHTHEWARVDASEDAPDGYVRKLAGHYCRLCGVYREALNHVR